MILVTNCGNQTLMLLKIELPTTITKEKVHWLLGLIKTNPEAF